MNRGLYIAMTSLVNNQKRMDVLSNNLSNINTSGYKKDYSISESFPEKLLAKKNRIGENRIRSVDNLTFETLENGYLARIKDGYFKIETPRGISHVKEMRFIVDGEYLKTSYKNYDDERSTLRENYVLDSSGNRVINTGNIDENFVNSLIYNPRSYIFGTMSGGVGYKRSFTDFSQGAIVDTAGKLDLALIGDGFFKLAGEDGIKFTRGGSFSLNGQNQIVDLDNRPVLGNDNLPIAIPNGELNISEDGFVSVDGQILGQIGIETIGNTEALRKIGDNLYEMGLDENGEVIPMVDGGDFSGRLLQGHLESSNMNPVDGMVDMITLLREFEANQKVIKMQDEMLEKAATEIARL